MREKVIRLIKEYKLIEKDDNIILGLSGGPDSLALFYILKDIRNEMDFKLYAAHINHQIRGEEADQDEKFAKEICERYEIPFYSKSLDVVKYAKEQKISEEEAGREIRYGFFYEIIEKLGKGKVAVAHNKNDQAETLIMRFLRGTGIDGLKGMDYKNGKIIRPILGITRSEIEEFCRENNITPRIDKTNLKPIYGRNKVRLELIPYIEKNFNQGTIDTLFRMSGIMKKDSEFINDYSEKMYKEIIVNELSNSISGNIEKFLELHESIKARVIRICIERLNNSLQGIEEKHIKKILRLIIDGYTGKMINVPNNIRVRISYGTFFVEKISKNEKEKKIKYKLKINDSVSIPELKIVVKSEIIKTSEMKLKDGTENLKIFDYQKIKGDLFIRTREIGDRFTPLGMNGSKKVKDFFINEKVPREKRDIIPIIADEDDILWIVGYRMSESYKVTNKTKEILIIESKKLRRNK